MLRPVSATLLLANVAFLVACGFTLIPSDSEGGRGLFLAGVALAHAAIAGWFLRTEGDRHPFGLLAAGTGLAAFSIAIPVWLGGPVVPVAWAAEAVALTWVATLRRHTFSAVVATLLGLGAIAHLGLFEYPFWRIFGSDVTARPFLNASGVTLLFILGALGVAGAISRWRELRLVLGSVGFALLIYAVPFELSGIALLAAWSLIFVLAWAADQRLDAIPGFVSRDGSEQRLDRLFGRLLVVPTAVSGGLAVLHAFVFELPLRDLTIWTQPQTPFWTEQGAAAGILVVASLAFAAISRHAIERHAGIVATFVVAACLMPFELEPVPMLLAWSVLALALFALPRVIPGGLTPFIASGAALVALSFLTTLMRVAPPSRLFVDARQSIDHPFFWSSATATLGAVAAVLAFASWLYRGTRSSRWASMLSGVAVVYLVSVGTVDIFQGRVGGQVALESLQKQAQVALSILWTVLGVGLFVGGIIQRARTLRIVGLALLGLSTAKVFVYDLASLDASYRVLSFIGLGILLLVSSWAYQRTVAPDVRQPGETPTT